MNQAESWDHWLSEGPEKVQLKNNKCLTARFTKQQIVAILYYGATYDIITRDLKLFSLFPLTIISNK